MMTGKKMFGIIALVTVAVVAVACAVSYYTQEEVSSIVFMPYTMTGTVTAVSDNTLEDGTHMRAVVLEGTEGSTTARITPDTRIYQAFINAETNTSFMIEIGLPSVLEGMQAEVEYGYEESGTLGGVTKVVVEGSESADAFMARTPASISGTLVEKGADSVHIALTFGDVSIPLTVSVDANTKVYSVSDRARVHIAHAGTPVTIAEAPIGATIYIEGEAFTGQETIGPVATLVIAPAE